MAGRTERDAWGDQRSVYQPSGCLYLYAEERWVG